MPLPAFRMTPEVPIACACSAESASSSSASPCGALAMRPTVAFRKVPTSSATSLESHLPASAEFRALSAMTSHVLKAFSRTSSESWNSRRGSRAWQVAGRNSAKSSSRAEISVATSTSASFISSRTVVLRPRTLSPTTSRLMSSLSSSSSSGRLSGSTSVGRCESTPKMPGSRAETYGLKSLPRVVAMRPAASCMYSRVGSSGANPFCVNCTMACITSCASFRKVSLPTASPTSDTHSKALPRSTLSLSPVAFSMICFSTGITWL
mmetsp:Transcript_27798/g.73475  ORF Transcript_27798/g.73475 Transcript_27798/m.73475 type:complete len:265 (+) Transcript_27798:1029-1823(+)